MQQQQPQVPLISKEEFGKIFGEYKREYVTNIFQMRRFISGDDEEKSESDDMKTINLRKKKYMLYTSFKAFEELGNINRTQLFYSDMDISIFSYKFVEEIERSIDVNEFDIKIVLSALFKEIANTFNTPIMDRSIYRAKKLEKDSNIDKKKLSMELIFKQLFGQHEKNDNEGKESDSDSSSPPSYCEVMEA